MTSRKRVGLTPDIPTVAEAGIPFLGVDSLIGVFGPRGVQQQVCTFKIAADLAIATGFEGRKGKACVMVWESAPAWPGDYGRLCCASFSGGMM